MAKKGKMPAKEPRVEIPGELLDQWRALSVRHDEACRNAQEGLQSLYDLAIGNDEGMREAAARDLIRILSNVLVLVNAPRGADGLVWSCDKEPPDGLVVERDKGPPEVFARLARARDSWPVLSYIHKERQQLLTAKAIEALQVGKDSGINYSGKWSEATPKNQIFRLFYDFIEQHRGKSLEGVIVWRVDGRDLSPGDRDKLSRWIKTRAKDIPQLSSESKEEWKEAIRELLPILFGADYERHPKLWPFGKDKEFRKPKYCNNLLPKTIRNNLRGEIHSALWEAMDVFAGVSKLAKKPGKR